MCDRSNSCWKIRNAHECGIAGGLNELRAVELAMEICQQCPHRENKFSLS
jgi:hypothetical protein